MKTFTFLVVFLVFTSVVLFTNVAFAQRGEIQHRIRHQWHRIDRALAAGKLSQPQADALHGHLRDIRSQFQSARDNGTLDSDTVQRLNTELDRNSMRIANMTGARIGRRLDNQWHRIDRALATGKLSQPQADALHRHLRDIRSQFQSARGNGTLDFDTIHRLNRELDRNSMRMSRMAQGGNINLGPLHLHVH